MKMWGLLVTLQVTRRLIRNLWWPPTRHGRFPQDGRRLSRTIAKSLRQSDDSQSLKAGVSQFMVVACSPSAPRRLRPSPSSKSSRLRETPCFSDGVSATCGVSRKWVWVESSGFSHREDVHLLFNLLTLEPRHCVLVGIFLTHPRFVVAMVSHSAIGFLQPRIHPVNEDFPTVLGTKYDMRFAVKREAAFIPIGKSMGFSSLFYKDRSFLAKNGAMVPIAQARPNCEVRSDEISHNNALMPKTASHRIQRP